jgi:hypothetical protein
VTASCLLACMRGVSSQYDNGVLAERTETYSSSSHLREDKKMTGSTKGSVLYSFIPGFRRDSAPAQPWCMVLSFCALAIARGADKKV